MQGTQYAPQVNKLCMEHYVGSTQQQTVGSTQQQTVTFLINDCIFVASLWQQKYKLSRNLFMFLQTVGEYFSYTQVFNMADRSSFICIMFLVNFGNMQIHKFQLFGTCMSEHKKCQ